MALPFLFLKVVSTSMERMAYFPKIFAFLWN
jgi:hypothetical protein